ncbi:MAG TPA: PilZ domain-containing protein [Planctomycetota bacterium]|nr:PilZ domain-containing protein [Planctomycetota bacterium]
MINAREERRRGVRLNSKLSSAMGFTCEHCGTLPGQALVADISEGGVHLLFEWPEQTPFPLRIGDGLGFHLKVEGLSRGFEIWSIVYRIDPRDRRGRVGVGVKFLGLDAVVREQLKKVLVLLAMTRLRVWRTDGQPAEAGRRAPGQWESNRSDSEAPMGAAAQPAFGPAGNGGPPDAGRGKLFLGEILLQNGMPSPERFEPFLTNGFCGMHPVGLESFRNGLFDEAAMTGALAGQQDWGSDRPASQSLRFPAQLRAEYRFLDSGRKVPVDGGPSFGLTREISPAELVLVGPLPGGVSARRIAEEALCMAIQVDCPSVSRSLTMGCTPRLVEPSEYEGEHRLHCRIDHFPDNGEQAWVRACMVRGAGCFRPQAMRPDSTQEG